MIEKESTFLMKERMGRCENDSFSYMQDRKKKKKKKIMKEIILHSNDLCDVRCALDIFVPCAIYIYGSPIIRSFRAIVCLRLMSRLFQYVSDPLQMYFPYIKDRYVMLFLIICNIYDNLSAFKENANNKEIYKSENVVLIIYSFL